MELVRPPTLAAFFEYGGDLSCFPALEGLAEAVVVQRRLNTGRQNRQQAAFCRRCVDAWVDGGTTDTHLFPPDFVPCQLMVTTFAWQAECLEDERLADRFEAALPPALLVENLRWVRQRQGEGRGR